MNLLAHITMHEVAFVLAVFLFGLISGHMLAWSRKPTEARDERRR